MNDYPEYEKAAASIPTWQEQCDTHPEHQSGMVTNQMIRDRMQEEIDALRAQSKRASNCGCCDGTGDDPGDPILSCPACDGECRAPQAQPLSDVEINNMWALEMCNPHNSHDDTVTNFARAIESAVRGKT